MPIKESSKGFKHFCHAFQYSMSGLKAALCKESAIRHELIMGIILVPLSFILPLSLVMRALLTAWLFLIFTVELLNTGIEAIVDLASPDWHELAKYAKDVASAAVFCILCSYGILWAFAIFEWLNRGQDKILPFLK